MPFLIFWGRDQNHNVGGVRVTFYPTELTSQLRTSFLSGFVLFLPPGVKIYLSPSMSSRIYSCHAFQI